MIPQIVEKFVVLAVLDGWGIAKDSPGNAVTQANTPNIDKFLLSCPHTQLKASGEAVGLPRGEEGSTETGHLNLGAGKIVYQGLARINMAIADGTFFENIEFIAAINHAKKNNSNLHYMGLIGSGWVHSNIEHLFALIRLAKENNLKNIYLHLFTDGRDSPPTSALTYIQKIKEVIQRESVGQIASIMGRYWAMDRDKRWDRTEKAYNALTKGIGHLVESPEILIKESYSKGKTDEFIEPSLITDKKGKPIAIIKENDAVVFFNFRLDRPRQLSKAFVYTDFNKAQKSTGSKIYGHGPEKRRLFNRGNKISNLYFVMMTEYGKQIVKEGAKVGFAPEIVKMPIGRLISLAGLRQLRIAESEKERFVTYYFNGLREKPFDKEERIIIASPSVATYDKKPEMSAKETTEKLLIKLREAQHQFYLINYANPDMVAHTGNIDPAKRACEVVDECIGKIAGFVLAYKGALVITADHGNAEEMIDIKTGKVNTEHTANPVLFIVISKELMGKGITLPSGKLADVGPTILSLLNINVPATITGRNLLDVLQKF